MRTLFSVEPKFTIDTCSFNEVFDDERRSNKTNFPGIWNGMSELIEKGEIISHREVYDEIMEGPYEELQAWCKNHKDVFAKHDFTNEGLVIAEIGRRGFVNFIRQHKTTYNADPWLVAQAKRLNLTIITEEKGRKPGDLPRVCTEMGVEYIDIFGLVRRQGWVLRRN